MSINWPAWISSFSDPSKSKVIGKMEFTTLPGAQKPGQAEIGNWLIAIPRDSQNAEAAMDFLLWATSAEQMKRSALARQSTDAQIALSAIRAGRKESSVPGSVAFAGKLEAAPAHAALERN